MSKKVKIIIISTCLVIIGIILFPKNFEFHKQSERPGFVEIPDSIYDFALQYVHSTDVAGISRDCAKATCKLLKFSFNQDVLFEKKVSRAHCVTYARLCATLCNKFYKEHGIDAEAIPVVGYITINGINTSKVLTSIVPEKYEHNFVNHDVVEIRSKGKRVWYIDPSEREFTGIARTYR